MTGCFSRQEDEVTAEEDTRRKSHLDTLPSLVSDDWMFSCQKSLVDNVPPTSTAVAADTLPQELAKGLAKQTAATTDGATQDTTHSKQPSDVGTVQRAIEDLHSAGPHIDLSTVGSVSDVVGSKEKDTAPRSTDAGVTVPHRTSGFQGSDGVQCIPESTAADKPRFSFANALPSIPISSSAAVVRQDCNSQEEEDLLHEAARHARQQLDASVADWLVHQAPVTANRQSNATPSAQQECVPSGDAQQRADGVVQPVFVTDASLQPSVTRSTEHASEGTSVLEGSTTCADVPAAMADAATPEEEASREHSMPAAERQPVQQSLVLPLSRARDKVDAAAPRRQPSIAFQLAGGDSDWMFNITCMPAMPQQPQHAQQQPQLSQQEQHTKQAQLAVGGWANEQAQHAQHTRQAQHAQHAQHTQQAHCAMHEHLPQPAQHAQHTQPAPQAQPTQLAQHAYHAHHTQHEALPAVRCAAPAQPAHPSSHLPSSVREAVDRFEAWSMSDSTASPPLVTNHAHIPALEPGHAQPLQQSVLSHSTAAVHQQQQQVLHSFPAQQVRHLSPPQHASSQQLVAPSGEPGAGSWAQRQQLSVPESQQLSTAPVVPSQQDSSHIEAAVPSPAVSRIDATLAAINLQADALPSPYQQQPTSSLKGENQQQQQQQRSMFTSVLPLQQHSGASSDGLSHLQPTTAVTGAAVRRPPLPARLPLLKLSARPAFTDALANPALLQQPWLAPSGIPTYSLF